MTSYFFKKKLNIFNQIADIITENKIDLLKGKPFERQGRKASGLSSGKTEYDSGATKLRNKYPASSEAGFYSNLSNENKFAEGQTYRKIAAQSFRSKFR